jgi:hypothetical protein
VPTTNERIVPPLPAFRRLRWWTPGSNFAWAASIFLTGLGAKLGLILYHGMAFPHWDQWPAEAIETFVPWLTGKFSLATLFAAHNEHRIVLARIYDLLLLWLNGQWDSLLEMTGSAVIYCAGVAAFGWVMESLLGRKSWPLLWVVLVLEMALPFAWENTIWAIQNQLYFMCVLSWLTLWLLGLYPAWSWRWWCGATAGVLALFTQAAGCLAAAAVGCVTVFVVLKRLRDWRRHLPTWIVCGALVVAGLSLKVNVPGHELAQPGSAAEFLAAFAKALAWPCVRWACYAPIALLPVCVLGWVSLRSPGAPKPAELLIFGIAIWAMLQALAAAYARGVGGAPPAFRYMDFLSFLAIANALGIWLLVEEYGWRKRFPILTGAGAAVWMVGCVAGLGFLTERVWVQYIPEVDAEQAARLASARAFMATDDPAIFLNEPATNRPVPNPEADLWLFRHPALRPVLPICVREPLRVVPETNGDGAFVPHGWLLSEADAPTERSWGSYSDRKEAARGKFESRPISASRLPFLEIPVAGDLGAPGLSLKLIELNSGNITEVTPPYAPHGTWLNVPVRAPAGPFKLVARDDSDSGWFAFKEPIEMGRLSRWTLRFLSGWECLVVLGGGLCLLNLTRWRRQRAEEPPLSNGGPNQTG